MAALAKGKPVAVFGEMVGVLWSQRQFTTALEVEKLWNDLATIHYFYLRCVYPASGFGDEMKIPYATVCAQHSHVISAESAMQYASQGNVGNQVFVKFRRNQRLFS
jgi:hypothetical protein